MSDFELTIERQRDSVRLKLRGELDISTGVRLEEDLRRVEATEPALIVLDLERLEFMDSTGLRLLITADSRARESGRRLVLVNVGAMVRRLLHVTRLDERLEISDGPAPAPAQRNRTLSERAAT